MRPWSRSLIIAGFMVLVCACMMRAETLSTGSEDMRQARRWLRSLGDDGEADARSVEYLLRMGESAFPAYEEVLADPKAPPSDVAKAFSVLSHLEVDRRRFIKYILARLTDKDFGIRHNGIMLLRELGSPADASPLVALLSDADTRIAGIAAWTLAEIGGPNELIALDVWLRGVSYRDKPDIRKAVKHEYGELKKRLDEEKDPEVRAQKIRNSWKELRNTEYHPPPEVHYAARQLTVFGNETVAFLKDHVHPVPAVSQKHLEQLLVDLDSDSFERREAAKRELSRGIMAEAVLEKALAAHPSLEMRRRLEAILKETIAPWDWAPGNPELLRQVRAVWVLQQIGTPEAKALLEKIAAGAPSARLTQKAKDAVQALEHPRKR